VLVLGWRTLALTWQEEMIQGRIALDGDSRLIAQRAFHRCRSAIVTWAPPPTIGFASSVNGD
jgi:hypothetical protein